ncbi:hypothetical protein GQ53DRAFT_656107 [Thozetella sp. PMI_491]|nr:hypothetical protein GQ53DRAFT_656107 [Thozetella sp. PMI_491]
MRSRLSSILPIVAVVLISLALPIAHAAGLQDLHERRHDGHVFPFLKWLRDSTVELIFGRPASRAKSKPALPNGALPTKYRNSVVVRFNVTNSEEEGALSEAADRLFLDVWAFTPNFVDVRIHQDDIAPLLTLLPDSLQPAVLIPDLAGAVAATYPSASVAVKPLNPVRIDPATVRPSIRGVDNIFFSDYQPLSVIVSWIRLLEAMFPSYVEIVSIGTSYEGRDIPAVRLGDRNEETRSRPSRKTILVTGGLHGREWISTSTVNYLIWSFITARGKDSIITKLLETFDVVFVPTLNPDGYEYTWDNDRLWRKSRQTTKMRYCRGLDLDHAFGYEWQNSKVQTDPCSESYGGDQPFQAVEASQLAAWAKNETLYNATFVGFLDLHSYSQQILFPYTHTCAIDPPNLENLEELAVGLAKAIRLASGESYSVASACEGAVARVFSASNSLPRIESGGGSAIDWFYHELNTRYAYQIKLRDTGSYGFLLPSDEIVPTGEEMFNAMKYFGDYLLGNNGIEKSLFREPEEAPTDEEEQWSELRKRRRR